MHYLGVIFDENPIAAGKAMNERDKRRSSAIEEVVSELKRIREEVKVLKVELDTQKNSRSSRPPPPPKEVSKKK